MHAECGRMNIGGHLHGISAPVSGTLTGAISKERSPLGSVPELRHRAFLPISGKFDENPCLLVEYRVSGDVLGFLVHQIHTDEGYE